jgi:hypothetical protein
MGKRPSDKYSLDRIDVNGDYEPNNCRWADDFTQANNARHNVKIEFEGEKLTAREWSEKLNISHKTINNRYNIGLLPKYILSTIPLKQIRKQMYEEHAALGLELRKRKKG